MKRIYAALLRLYPYDYRAMFSSEMLTAFEATIPNTGVIWFAAKEMLGLAAGATAEWIAKINTDPLVRGRKLPDIRMMRPVGIAREVWFAGVGERGCSSDTSR
jgi:hypothetical protein